MRLYYLEEVGSQQLPSLSSMMQYVADLIRQILKGDDDHELKTGFWFPLREDLSVMPIFRQKEGFFGPSRVHP